MSKSIVYFERALQHDPSFAQACAGIAMAYLQLGYSGNLTSRDAFEKARAAAEKALELDDTVVDAQLAVANTGQILHYDQASAKLAYERDVELAPSSAVAHDFYGIMYLSPMGRHEEAIAELRRAVELDPVSVLYLTDLGWVYYMARQSSWPALSERSFCRGGSRWRHACDQPRRVISFACDQELSGQGDAGSV